MKGVFLLLFLVFTHYGNAQITDTISKKMFFSDSVTRSLSRPRVTAGFGFNTFNRAPIGTLQNATNVKVRLYWDPIYLKYVPFPVHTNYKETWFTKAASIAVEFLVPYKKIER